jgi:CheY-like chemotaxis protein
MFDFDTFREALRDALYHLQDPQYEPAEVLCGAVGCAPDAGAGPIQVRLAGAVEALQPDPGTPSNSRAWLHYESLYRRFVLGLTQEQTAQHLHMSVRTVQRVQGEAIHLLARQLWESRPGADDADGAIQAADWRAQAGREVASLRETMPNAQSDVSEIVREVIGLEEALASTRGVDVTLGFVQENLVAAAHPSVLRQTLITAIGHLAPYVAAPAMTIYGNLEDGEVKITLTGSLADATRPRDVASVDEVIAPPEATLELRYRGQQVYLQVRLPAVGKRTVLVVEDNPDMVYFYRRCTTGTMYRIVHAQSDRDLFAMVAETDPDIIVLDVMLPYADGWQLLSHLSQRSETRDIPIIVCSVVKEERLALALGATAFLSKPIRPRQFVAALDRVLRPASSESSTAQESSAVAS